MEIIVEGKGTSFFTPDQVILNLNFINKENTYEEALAKGSKNTEVFVSKLLNVYGFNKKDMKTRNFVIREEKVYNEINRKYELDGYSFNQSAILKFDYDIVKMSKILEDISKLDNSPICQVSFGIKNEKKCRRSVLKNAYKDAFEQAKTIAEAAGTKLKRCVKIDFKPFITNYTSQTKYDTEMLYAKRTNISVSDAIANTFTPEDIELTETLYCLWEAE